MRLHKLTALAVTAAVAVSIPAAALADQGGVSHSSKPCPSKSQAKKAKKAPKNTNGKKCGFQRTPPPVDETPPVETPPSDSAS